MSEAAFETAREEAHAEEAEDIADVADIEATEQEDDAPPAKNWEKIAQDKDAALAAERSRRKTESRRARDLEARIEKMESAGKSAGSDDEMLTLIASLRDDDEDPITDIATVKKALKTFMDRQKADMEAETQSTRERRAVTDLVNQMNEHEADFAADHPDYHDAAKHYRMERQGELEELGFSGQALQQRLAQDLFGVVQTALGAGRDPAEAVYKLAAKRGFKSGASEAADKLKKIADSASAGRTPSGASGNKGPLSWGDVSKLSGAARDAAWKSLRDRERKAG